MEAISIFLCFTSALMCTLFQPATAALTPIAYRVSIVAGTGAVGFSGDGGAATAAKLNHPTSVAVDAAGNVYFSDYFNRRIRKIDLRGAISTIAGNGTGGFSGDGGPALRAAIGPAYGVSVGPSGAVYIADSTNQRVRKIASTGIITTIAGTGEAGFGGDDGVATAALLNNPDDVLETTDGTLYIADTGNNRIRRIDRNGIITTFAGSGGLVDVVLSKPSEITQRPSGGICFVDFGVSSIRCIDRTLHASVIAGTGHAGFNGDRILATKAQMNQPGGLAFDAAGDLILTDGLNYRIRRVNADGTIETIAGTEKEFGDLDNIVAGPQGSFYFADFGADVIRKLTPLGNVAGFRVGERNLYGRVSVE